MFIEERLPTEIAIKMSGGPEFSTTISECVGGIEYRNINWPKPRNRYTISKTLCTKQEISLIQNWFRISAGKANGFRFKDPLDHQSENEFIAKANGQDKEFQLIKSYSIGSYKNIREIKKPASKTVYIYLDGKKAQAKIDLSKGIIIFNEPPINGQVITANFEFDIPVRFDSDLLQISCAANNLFIVENLDLIEIL